MQHACHQAKRTHIHTHKPPATAFIYSARCVRLLLVWHDDTLDAHEVIRQLHGAVGLGPRVGKFPLVPLTKV